MGGTRLKTTLIEDAFDLTELTTSELHALMEPRQGLVASLFLPTHRVSEADHDPLHLKNLLREADRRLKAGGMRSTKAKELLKPGYDLIDHKTFWLQQGQGLAVFLAHGWSRWYRLPFPLPETVVVAPRFHLKPILPRPDLNARFLILAVSQNSLRLFEATPHRVEEWDLTGVPTSMAEALKYDQPESQLQLHSAGRAQGGPASHGAIFHGQGVGTDDTKTNILRYLQEVDKKLRPRLNDEHVPMVVAAVKHVQPIVRETTSYPHVLHEGIEGNPDGLSPDQLHGKAWNVIQPQLTRARREAARRFEELHGAQNDKASDDLDVVLRGAHHGRVDTLFVALDRQRWGSFDVNDQTVVTTDGPSPEVGDLLDRAAVMTFANRGTVYVGNADDLPGRDGLAAIFRY